MALKGSLAQDYSGQAKDILGTENLDPNTSLLEGERTIKGLKSSTSSYVPKVATVTQGEVPSSYERILGEGNYHPDFGYDYNQELLHSNQSATGVMANTLFRFGAEVLSTAGQTMAYDSDLNMGAQLSVDTEREFGNVASRIFEDLRDKAQRIAPIYADPYKEGTFDPGSMSWWGENAISVGSSIGMVLPAALLSSVTGGLGTAAGLDAAMVGSNAFKGITTALWSRHAENLMEASGVYKQAFNEAKGKGMSDSDAKKVASLGASNTYNKQWALLAQDIPQYILLNKLGSFAKGGAAAEKAAVDELSPSVQKFLGYGSLNTTAKRVGAVAKDMAGESGEEMYQFLINEQSNLMARNAADPNHNVKHSMIDVIKSNYDNGDMWTAGFWGAAGAGVMQASMKGLNYKIQESVNKAQLETVTAFGPMLKQAYSEYDAALKDNDPRLAEQATPAFVVSLAMKAKKTGTVAALKDIMKQMKNAPEGTSFDQYGVDKDTQGRLKQDPAFYEQVEKGIDRVSELYDRYVKENQSNKAIPQEDKEPKAQAMANTKFLLDSTTEHAKKLEMAVSAAWPKIEGVLELSESGREAERLKQTKISKERSLAAFKKRQTDTDGTASDTEKKQIELAVSKLAFEIAEIENLIDEELGNKEKGIKGKRTAKEVAADKKIVLPQDQVDEYIKQSKRLNAANASIAQLTEIMDELRSSIPLGETIKKQVEAELGTAPDKMDKDNNLQLDDKVEYEDPDTKEVIKGKIVGIEEADEDKENDVNSLVIETDKGETIIKPESELHKVGDETSDIEDDLFDSLSEEDEKLLGRASQVEDEESEKQAMLNMNKLSYSQWDPVSKQHINRNAALAAALSDKNTSFAGSQAFYRLDTNDTLTKEILTALVTNGVYSKDSFKIVVTDKQRGILKKFINGNKLTKEDINTLLDESVDSSFTSFVDGFPISVELNLNSTSYYGGLYLHTSRFMPDSSVPVKEKNKGNTPEARKANVVAYKKSQYPKNRQMRRDLMSILLQGGKASTNKLDRSKGTPNSAKKTIKPSERNQNLETAFGIEADKIKLGITKSNNLTPELTTLYLDKNSPIKGTSKTMQGKGNIYAYIAGEGLNDEAGIIKLNKALFDREFASILLDAFFLVGQAKISKRSKNKKTGKPVSFHSHSVRFSEEVLKRHGAKITGITAGELIDLFVVNGEKITEPRNARFQKRYGKDPVFSKLMTDKRLYLYIKGKDVVLVYGQDSKGNPNLINLNQHGLPADVADLTTKREHFIDWLVANKRMATHLFDPTLGKGKLNLNGDFLDDRTINIEYKTRDAAGKSVKKAYHREKGQTYSSFLIKNGIVLTDVSRENGSLFKDPVVNLNLVNSRGGLNITSNVKPLEVKKSTIVSDKTVVNEDLANKQDATFSDTKEEKEEKKPTVKKKEVAYKNRFIEKKDRELLDIETSEVVENNNAINTVSRGIEVLITEGTTIDEVLKYANDTLTSFKVEFGRGSKKNQNVIEYIKDRFAGKTNRTLREEFDAATTPNTDKTSATSTEATGTPVETTVNNSVVEEEEQSSPPPSMDDLLRMANNESSEEPPFAREEVTTPYESYTKEIRQKEIDWAFDIVGIAKEEWQLKQRITDLLYKGKRNFALYSHSAILLFEAAELGTVYHEAFHRVSLGYLTPDERKRFYRAARLAYGLDKESTDKQVEEILAEKFRSFILSDNKQRAPGLVQKFFDWIMKGIKSLFYGERRLSESDINTLFKQIRNGKYRNSTVLEVNKESLGDELYARAIIKGVEFDTLNNRKDFRTITNSLAKTLLIQSKVEDLNDAEGIDFVKLVEHLEKLRDGFKANAEYKGNTKEVRERSRHLYEMYDEILGTKDEQGRYDTFQQVIKPAIDSFLLTVGIKQVEVNEAEYLGVDTEDIESISRLGDHYIGAAYELNKRDTALPAIKYLVATLNADSELVEDTETGALKRVPKVNPVTMLYEPIEFKQVWSKAFHALHHLNSIEEMIEELKYIASHDNYAPFAELAGKLEKESTNLRTQFFKTLSCAEYDFINIGFQNNSGTYKLTLNRSSEQSAINDTIRNWDNIFFNSDDIVETVTQYNAKKDKTGKVLLDKKGNPIPDLEGDKSYLRRFKAEFFQKEEKKYSVLSQDISDVVNKSSRNYEGKLVKFLPRVVDLLSDFGIIVDENTIRRVISDIQGETIDNDVDRLYNWVENELVTLFTSKAAETAVAGDRVERSKHGFFKIGAVKDISRAFIDVHPELKSDIQVGPGDGDTKRQHKRNTFAENSHTTDVVNRIKNTEGYVEERITNLWTRRSRILRSMVPYDLADEQQVAAAKEARDKFKLVTYSYLRETGTEDKGRGYLNMTEREDYVVRFHLLMTESLLPFPIMAQRKTYFYMDGVERFKNTVTNYDPRSRNMQFSDEVINYFWDAYRDENERVAEAVKLISAFKQAKGEEKEALRKQLIVNYHFTGAYNTDNANAVNLIRFRGFKITDTFDDATKKAFTKQVTTLLNKRITNELQYANSLGVIAFDTDTNGYIPGIINQSSIGTYSSERDEDIDFGVRATVGEYTINYIMSIIESERVFMGDPALFIKNKNSGEVVEDLYKRYYGMGSTGQPYAEMINEDVEETTVTYNTATIRTQEFESLYYKSLVALHTKLWKAYFDEIDPKDTKNLDKAKDLAEKNLKKYKKVDATDGGAIISPSMYKSMLKRSGAFNKKVQYAFELLMSDKTLSPDEEIKALNIVLNPQKTVYFGMHSENGIDKTIYDKMSMSIIFPRLVKGTHLEKVLDRMEKTGEYRNNKDIQKIQVLNYDTAIKIGLTVSHDLYVNKETRDEITDLTDIVIENRYWKNLRQQMTTDAHAVASKQMVGTQVFKISSSNIIMDQPYGNFENGRDLINALTKSRMAVSENGKHHVEAALGIRNGIVNNRSLIEMLRRDALSAKKTDDFRSALKLDDDGRMYLELDAFPDRSWVYSRLMNLVTSNTIDLKLPGSQLIQVSDYGYSSTGLQTAEKEFRKELKFYEVDDAGNKLISMECRVPIRAFKRLIPNYDKLTHAQRVAVLPKDMQIMGYRIPTQGQNSVVNMKVVDYLPDQAGEIIHLPLEFTTLTGSDFDIDKLFTMMKNYRIENGVLKEVTFNDSTDQEGVNERYDRKIQELYKIYRNDHTVFSRELKDQLKGIKEDVRDDKNTVIAFAQDSIIIKNLIQNIESNKKALESSLDEISKKHLEDIINSEQTYLDDLLDKSFVDVVRTETWNKQKPIILKALQESNKIDQIGNFSKLSIEEQNTSEANENRMFDIFQTVISDLKHARNTTLPLGSLTDELKEKANKYIKARSGGKVVPLEAFESETPAYQSATKFKFMTSTKGIGVYALQNANHALTQQANVRLRTKFMYGKQLNKNGSVPLDLIEGNDLRYITDWLSAMLDAHVDAIKDNYIAELNINSATYSVTSLLLRLGFGVSTFDLMAQPIIVDLAKEYYNMGGGRHSISEDAEYEDGTTIQKAYIRVKRKLLSSLNRSVEDEGDLDVDLVKEGIYVPLAKLMEDKDLLLDGINPSKNTTQEHKLRQLNFLEHFMNISTDAEKVNSLVLNTRVDTKSFGSNPVEFRHFMNKLIALEQEDVPRDKRDFINLDRLINSRGEYVKDGTMLSPLLNNSIFYLEKIFNDKSIVGSTGFNRMFWSLTTSIPDSEKFRMSTVNSMTGDLFSAIIANFFSDPRFGVSMTKGRLAALFTSNKNSIFTTLMKVKSTKFKYYDELKDNKALNMLQIDSKPLTSVESHITTPFQALSDAWDNDDYIADFKALIEHEDDTVRLLGRQLYLYAFYSTGFRHKRYDYLNYLPTSANKEINMVNSETKKENPVSFNKFIRHMLEELNDPASVVEFYTDVKKDFFENNWYNYRYVPRIGSNVNYSFDRDEQGFINYAAMQFGRTSKYALGTNEDGDIVYPSYLTIDGGADIAQYQIPRSSAEMDGISEDEAAFDSDDSATEESDIIGGNTALFKLVGVSRTIDEETNKPQDLAIYVPINKKGSLSYGMITTEMGIKSDESFIKYNNLIKQKPIEARIKDIKKEMDNFKEIPFAKQQVVNRIVRTVSQEAEANYAEEMNAIMESQLEEDTQRRLAARKIVPEDSPEVLDATIKEQFNKTPDDDVKGKEVEDIC